MAEAWSVAGINCNAIAPGFFATELTATLFEDDSTTQRLAACTASGFDLVVDAVGSGATRNDASEYMRQGGVITHIGMQDS